MLDRYTAAYLFLIASAIASFYLLTGTIQSGYQLVDDHELIMLHNALQVGHFSGVVASYVSTDLLSRFRPLYCFQRVVEVRLFGLDFLALSIYTGTLFTLTSFFFFLGCIKQRFTKSQSLLFLALALVGPQMAIWWRLGPNETFGVFLLSISFLFVKTGKPRSFVADSLFVASLVLASWCKESFTLVIPAFVFLKFSILWREQKQPITKLIVSNLYFLVPIIVLVVNISIILFYVGTLKVGYAGVDPGVRTNVERVWGLLQSSNLSVFVDIFIAILLLALVELKRTEKVRAFSIAMSVPFVFLVLVFLPNAVLYAKSGMMERYLLPSTLGFSFFVVSYLRTLENKHEWLRGFVLGSLCVICSGFFLSAFENAKIYAKSGLSTRSFLSTIVNNSDESSKILLVAAPVADLEWSDSVRAYLQVQHRCELYGFEDLPPPAAGTVESGLRSLWLSWFHGRMFADLVEAPNLIVGFDHQAIALFVVQHYGNSNYLELSPGNGFVVFKRSW